ncbi:MAG: hypothetical protein ACLFSZ_05260 [Puniceicoccaceae bacterium]
MHPGNGEEDTGLVLRLTESGENFWCLAFLSRLSGLYHPLVRKSRTSARPDLFDTARARVTRAKQGGLRFLSEYQPRRRRTGIGRSYAAIRTASRFAEILRRNTAHLPEPAAICDLSERFFDEIEAGAPTGPAFLKTLYLLAKAEGLPVKEDWVAGLPSDDRTRLRAILLAPLGEQGPEAASAEDLAASLEKWLVAKADFLIGG